VVDLEWFQLANVLDGFGNGLMQTRIT